MAKDLLGQALLHVKASQLGVDPFVQCLHYHGGLLMQCLSLCSGGLFCAYLTTAGGCVVG